MNISLRVIQEKLALENNAISISIYSGSTFSHLHFSTPDIEVYKSNVLYISEHLPPPKKQLEEHCGFVFVGCSKASVSADAMYIRSELTIHQIFNKISDIFEMFRRWDERLRTSIYIDSNIESILEIVYEILGNPSYIVDSSFKLIALNDNPEMCELSITWKYLTEHGYLPFDTVSNLIKSKELERMEFKTSAEALTSNYFYTPFINYNLRHQGKIQGHFFVIGMYKKITQGDIELANYLGEFVLEALINNDDFLMTRGQIYEHFLLDIITGKLTNRALISKQLKFLNFSPNNFFMVAKIKLAKFDEFTIEFIYRYLENYQSMKPIIYDKSIVAIIPLPEKDYKKRASNIFNKIVSEVSGIAGISDIADDLLKLRKYYNQAEKALELGVRQNPGEQDRLYFYDTFAISHILSLCAEKIDLRDIYTEELILLEKYDKTHSADLLSTLSCYLENERNALLASKKLFIHRNTLQYRLSKIDSLCHLDLGDPRVRKRLIFAFEAYNYLKAQRNALPHEHVHQSINGADSV